MNEELDRERRTLARSQRDIAEGELRIERQIELIAKMSAHGGETEEAERLLDLLRDTLAAWKRHLALTAARVAKLELRERRGYDRDHRVRSA